MKDKWKLWIGLTGVMTLAAAVKVWLLVGNYFPFNADEAVVALMARHILQGQFPAFFYGQVYMGSLDAFLVAVAFGLFGEQVWAIRLVQVLLYSGVLVTTAWLGSKAFDSWKVGLIGALLLAIPTVNVTLYTTVSLGGYGESLLLGNLILIASLKIARDLKSGRQPPSWLWLGLGGLAGLGFWAFSLTLVYSLPAGGYLAWLLGKRWQNDLLSRKQIAAWAGWAAAGAVLGAAPWWGYALQYGWKNMFWELRGGAIAGVERLPWLWQASQHLSNLFLLGSTVIFGLRPPWEMRWLALPLLPFALMFWMGVIAFALKRLEQPAPDRAALGILMGVGITLCAVFVISPFGADPSGRYFVPLAVPLALFAALAIVEVMSRQTWWGWALIILVLGFNLWGTIQAALRFPPGLTTQFYAPTQVDHRYMGALIDFLSAHNQSYGYTNYWVSYPLAFLSSEKLIFIPRLPYHLDFRYTERDDRYPLYDQMVAGAEKPAYITTHHPALDQYLRKRFTEKGISWKETDIGDYHVFFDLSETLRPQDIGLGVQMP